jgi:hypothetical protein
VDADRFKYKEITDIILRSFYEAYNELGDGFPESVYESAENRNSSDLYMIIKEKILVMISVDRWLNSYNSRQEEHKTQRLSCVDSLWR